MNDDERNIPSPPGRRAGNEGAAKPHSQFLVYQTEDGQVKIDVRLQGETAWLTQAHMAELFQITVPNVNMRFTQGQWSCIKNTIYIKSRSPDADTRYVFYATL